ncbi:MAG: SPOR domain-containing protein [Bacteroidota bacterium]|nr:SPOR domain-containing protein [Bacteroidota bacterium]
MKSQSISKAYHTQLIGMFLLSTSFLAAQLSEQDVRQRLDLIHSGKIAEVRIEVQSLLSQIPSDPGVQYLDAYVTESGDQAVKKYQTFVDTYPSNEWADDALYKVYQYYYAVGLYKTADAKLNLLNEQYPNSIYAKREVKPEAKPVVKTETTPVVEEKKEVVIPTPITGNFVVQIGVYSQEVKAQQQAAELSTTVGKQAIVFAKQSGEKTVYAVGFESFTDEQSARAFGAELQSKFNLEWFLVKR